MPSFTWKEAHTCVYMYVHVYVFLCAGVVCMCIVCTCACMCLYAWLDISFSVLEHNRALSGQ